MSDEIPDLIMTRESTHGSFELAAVWRQHYQALINNAPSYERLSAAQRYSIDMVGVKLGRILHGNPHEPDHWLDIAGYAQLAVPGAKVDEPEDQNEIDRLRDQVFNLHNDISSLENEPA